MRFLCLPGGYSSAMTMQTQLSLFCDSLQATGDAHFFFTQGTTPVEPPPELAGFFGPPPNFTFAETVETPDFNIRDFPRRETPEATMKFALGKAGDPTFPNIRSVVDRLVKILDDEPDIGGIIGFSEGAEIAASLILEEQRRQNVMGRAPHLKCAVLICGWPPVNPVSGKPVLADEDADMITIPTCHVVGAADPFLDAAMALYNLCDPDSADLFDHGGGHVIPRTRQTVEDLTTVVREMITQVSCAA